VYEGIATPPVESLAAVSIVRSGDVLLHSLLAVAPALTVGKILIQRDEASADKAPKVSPRPPPIHSC